MYVNMSNQRLMSSNSRQILLERALEHPEEQNLSFLERNYYALQKKDANDTNKRERSKKQSSVTRWGTKNQL